MSKKARTDPVERMRWVCVPVMVSAGRRLKVFDNGASWFERDVLFSFGRDDSNGGIGGCEEAILQKGHDGEGRDDGIESIGLINSSLVFGCLYRES